MSFLMDTHTLIWAVLDTTQLSKKAKAILVDTRNEVFVSSINFWEISLKYALGKLELKGVKPEKLPELAKESGFEMIHLLPEESASYHKLEPIHHRDPFDRMLIWQSIQRGFVLITKDKNIQKYHSMGLKTLW